jgi:hypothetical protein
MMHESWRTVVRRRPGFWRKAMHRDKEDDADTEERPQAVDDDRQDTLPVPRQPFFTSDPPRTSKDFTRKRTYPVRR